MADTTQPKELSINDLLSSEKYIIPLYQRNYAWGENEITQLLQDIWDKCEENKDGNYYIGTLIVDKRNDGSLEIIDGQQRHTTLTLINAVLKKTETSKIPNLYFDARVDVQNYIIQLYANFESTKNITTDNEELINIKNAIKYIESFFYQKDFSKFQEYFYKNVKIIRVFIPEGTDINHYFEVMNNRGEQLEKHEILKAKFISNIEEGSREKFALIWDACSQMDRQIQSCFSPENRKEIFGDNYSHIPKDILSKINIINSDKARGNNILGILANHKIPDKYSQNIEQQAESKYKSIIDFPNFLLQILKLQNNNVSLDDKKLLDNFGYPNNLPEAPTFINALLYYRTLFDKYIIKREQGNDDWAWDLSKPSKSENEDNLYYVNTFEKNDKDDLDDSVNNKRIIMIQSMLHVSFSANNNKNWLNEVLKHFSENSEIKKETLLSELEKICKVEFEKVKDKYHQGTHTPRFLFNCLDYVLWVKYELKYDKNKLSKEDKERFEKFKFSQNNSVEHISPQTPIDGSPPIENLNNFGNLCLISSSSNSRFSNMDFNSKKSYLKPSKQTESLKQIIIFSNGSWTEKEIQAHEQEMITLLEEHYNKSEKS